MTRLNERVQSVIESLKSARLPESALKPALLCQSVAIIQHPGFVKLLLAENTTIANVSVALLDEGVMQKETK